MDWDKDNYLTVFVMEIDRYFAMFCLAIPHETMSKAALERSLHPRRNYGLY